MLLRSMVLVVTLVLGACATTPYRYGVDPQNTPADRYPAMQQQVYQGAPHKVLDAADWYWPNSLLGKLLLWNKDLDSHEISPQTLRVMRRYLACNDLGHVQVLANRYAPGNQWSRLFRNRTVGAGWRYTLGILSVSLYTILPGRFFGGDAYNPYTNTIYLYSDDASVALHEAGHAKDFAGRKYKGTHAALYALPFASLYYEARATSDALGYSQAEADAEQFKEEYRTLYPAYTTYIGGNLLPSNPIGLLGVIPGHIVGGIRAASVPDDFQPPEPRAENECLAAPELLQALESWESGPLRSEVPATDELIPEDAAPEGADQPATLITPQSEPDAAVVPAGDSVRDGNSTNSVGLCGWFSQSTNLAGAASPASVGVALSGCATASASVGRYSTD